MLLLSSSLLNLHLLLCSVPSFWSIPIKKVFFFHLVVTWALKLDITADIWLIIITCCGQSLYLLSFHWMFILVNSLFSRFCRPRVESTWFPLVFKHFSQKSYIVFNHEYSFNSSDTSSVDEALEFYKLWNISVLLIGAWLTNWNDTIWQRNQFSSSS